MITTDLQGERDRVLAHARAIVDGAKTRPNLELTASEQAEVAADLEKVKTLDKQLADRAMVNRVKALGKGVDWTEGRSPVFSDADREGIERAVKNRTGFRTTVDTKAMLTATTMLPPSGEVVQPGLHPNVYPLSGLFVNEPASGPTIRYYAMSSGSAAVVAEGAQKPDAGIGITPKDLALEKIAALATFTDEMADYAPYLVQHITQELSAACAQAENARIINTFNTTSGVLAGAGTAATVVDSIADAIAGQEAISGLTPSAVIAHPATVAAIRKTKSTGSGVYTLDPTEPGPTAIWGTPVISTPVVPTTVVWVVEATGVAIYRRGQLVVMVDPGATGWENNTQTARAEERMATAVMRPSSLTKITLS
jgi:hypothetical protein